MNIPKYVIELLSKSEYNFTTGDVGYTINIHKPVDYMRAGTFNTLIKRLVKWANRQYPTLADAPIAYVNRLVGKTHYCDQIATVTIYDPVMQKIEPYICYKKGVRL